MKRLILDNEKENNNFQFSCPPTKITTHWNFIWWRENKGGGTLHSGLGGSFMSACPKIHF